MLDEHIQTLSSGDPVERQHARLALIDIGQPAVARLIPLLKDPAKHVRWEAAKTLGGIADSAAAPELVQALADEDSDVCWVAAEALISLGRQALEPLATALIQTPRAEELYQGAHHVVHHLSPSVTDVSVDALLKALSREEPEVSVPTAAHELLNELRSSG